MIDEVILIGNGTSVLDYEAGDDIDRYKTVVRFNSYRTIKKYQKHVGTKTDIWVTCNERHKAKINDFDKVLFHSWSSEKNCKLYNKLKELRPDIEKLKKEYIEYTGLETPSTGLIAIMYFLEKQYSITLHGFDWWEREEHHYGDKELRGTLHDPQAEYEVIKKLGNRIKFLR